MRPRATFLIVLAIQLGALYALIPASALAVPTVAEITYLNGPFARQSASPKAVATLHLSAPAAGDTVVDMNSDTAFASVADVTVPDGQTSAVIEVVPYGVGSTFLSATLGTDTVSASPDLEIRTPLESAALAGLSLEPTLVAPGQSSTATVTLDFIAPPGGTTVTLSSDNPKVHVPSDLTVDVDQYQGTFLVLTDPDASGFALIAASYDGTTKQAMLEIEPPDLLAPQTTLGRVVIRARARRATFRFSSNEPGSTFLCKLDRGPFRPCSSPRTYRRLKLGRHVFQVAARDGAGNTDASPARRVFRIRRARR